VTTLGYDRAVRAWIGPALIGLALLGLAPARASACKPVWPVPIEVQRPTWSAELELVDERIELECEARGHLSRRCHWRTVLVYEGTPGTTATGELNLAHELELGSLRVHVNGEPALHPGALHVEDAGHVEIEVEFDLEVWTLSADTCVWAAGFARHPLVASPYQEATFVVHEGKPLQLRSTVTRLQVRAPPAWRVTLDHGPDSKTRKFSTTMETYRLYRVRLDNRPLAHGPFIAAGVGFGPQVRARLRAGWEFAGPPLLLYSVAVESDAVEELMLIPAIEVASPIMLGGFFPSGGVGVGAPVMLLPDPLAGVRTQLSLSWPYVGLIGSVDVYPRPDTPAVRGALMLQVSI
jgi:hypothetical protein